MKRALKWLGIIGGGLLLPVMVGAAGLAVLGSIRLGQSRTVEARAVTVQRDEAALARGEHLVDVFCRDCHGADLRGRAFFDGGPIGTIHAANLTGLAETHSDADLVRAIRHGLDQDGRQLMIMPAESFIHFSQEDLAAVIAYLKTVPRAGEEQPLPQIGPVGRILVGAGLFDSSMPATYIDHELPFPAMPAVGDDAAYGQYLAGFCQSCHGADLAGGQPPDPESPAAPNLTPAGNLGAWTEEDFLTVMRTGRTPDGRQLNPAFMPWTSIGKLADAELRGLWRYLGSLSPQETAGE